MSKVNIITMSYDKSSGKILVLTREGNADLARAIYLKQGPLAGGIGPIDIITLDSNSMYDRSSSEPDSQVKEVLFEINVIDPNKHIVSINGGEPCTLHGTSGSVTSIGFQALISHTAKDKSLYICKNISFAESVNSFFKNLEPIKDGESLSSKFIAEIKSVRDVQAVEKCRAGACDIRQKKLPSERDDWLIVVSMAGVWIDSVKTLSLLLHSLTNDSLESVLNLHISDLEKSGFLPTPMTLIRAKKLCEAKVENLKGSGKGYAHRNKLKKLIKSKFEKKHVNSPVATSTRDADENLFKKVLISKDGAINAAFDQALIDKAIYTLIEIAARHQLGTCALALITRDDGLCDSGLAEYISSYAGISDVRCRNGLSQNDSDSQIDSCITTFDLKDTTGISLELINTCKQEADARDQRMISDDGFNQLILDDLSRLPKIHRCNLELLKAMREASFKALSGAKRNNLLAKNQTDYDDAIRHFNEKIIALSEVLNSLFQRTIAQAPN